MRATPYPVAFEATRPQRFTRRQLVLRLAILLVLSVFHLPAGGLIGVLYLLLPLLAAILVSRRSHPGFRQSDTLWLTGVLDWVLAFYAYLLFLTDRFPAGPDDRESRLDVSVDGAPTLEAALARLITSIPHVLALLVLGFASFVVWIVAAVAILVSEQYPESLWSFQRDFLAWVGRLLAYHSSLVEPYPPFSMSSGRSSPPSSSVGHGVSSA